MEVVSKISELLNKPLHFLIVGLFILIWGLWVQPSLDYVLYGILFILIASCTFIDKQFKKHKAKKEAQEQKTKDNEKKEKIRQQIINKYKNMSHDDRYVIDSCLNNNYQIFKDNLSINKQSIVSLCSQGWGISNDFNSVFTMKTEHFNILQEYKKSKRLKKHSSKKKGKQHGKE